jgi:murein DD-endopeptidase MepM/ murein hydrolase activator NlpD
VEIRARYGSPVAAAAGGRVVAAGWRAGGLGYTVMLAHRRGLRTLYGHLARIDVRMGERVAAGAWLGVVGWTGTRSHRPALHFQVRVRGAAVPPRFTAA